MSKRRGPPKKRIIYKKSWYKLSLIDINWIKNLPKISNINGCWIPTLWKPGSDGYISIIIEGNSYQLHRLVLCIYHNLKYKDYSWDTRHSIGCDRACFNYEHLKIGTCIDNIKDSVKDKTHKNSRKNNCSKCGGEYTIHTIKSGWNRGKITRICKICSILRNHKF